VIMHLHFAQSPITQHVPVRFISKSTAAMDSLMVVPVTSRQAQVRVACMGRTECMLSVASCNPLHVPSGCRTRR
jgi:hypothetical protein